MVMWDEIFFEVAKAYPDVVVDRNWWMRSPPVVLKPQTLDVVVATNLHADILSDLAAALAGPRHRTDCQSQSRRRFPSCSSPSMVRPSISRVKASPTHCHVLDRGTDAGTSW
jgi:tartrate dehydrogenase/decarboxylase/D-malate dehydrogenase